MTCYNVLTQFRTILVNIGFMGEASTFALYSKYGYFTSIAASFRTLVGNQKIKELMRWYTLSLLQFVYIPTTGSGIQNKR